MPRTSSISNLLRPPRADGVLDGEHDTDIGQPLLSIGFGILAGQGALGKIRSLRAELIGLRKPALLRFAADGQAKAEAASEKKAGLDEQVPLRSNNPVFVDVGCAETDGEGSDAIVGEAQQHR